MIAVVFDVAKTAKQAVHIRVSDAQTKTPIHLEHHRPIGLIKDDANTSESKPAGDRSARGHREHRFPLRNGELDVAPRIRMRLNERIASLLIATRRFASENIDNDGDSTGIDVGGPV